MEDTKHIESKTSPAELQDIPALTEVLNSALRIKIKHGDFSWGTLDNLYQHSEVEAMLNQGQVMVLKEGSQIVGCVLLTLTDTDELWPENEGAVYAHRLAIDEAHTGKGYGQKLLELSAEFAKEHNRTRLRLDCNADIEGLCKYYKDAGFNLVGTKERQNHKIAALFEKIV